MAESGDVADLVEWDYWRGGQGELGDEEEALLAIGELPPEMQLACLEQGVLSMSLDLQRAAWHRHMGMSEELKKRPRSAWLQRKQEQQQGKCRQPRKNRGR